MEKLDSNHLYLLWKSAAKGNLVKFKDHCDFILSNVDKSSISFLGEIISAVGVMQEKFKGDEKAEEILSKIDIQCDVVAERIEQAFYDSLSAERK